MADEVDVANENVEKSIEARIKYAAAQKIPENTTGECWFCGKAVPDSRRWCDADCRDLYVKGG